MRGPCLHTRSLAPALKGAEGSHSGSSSLLLLGVMDDLKSMEPSIRILFVTPEKVAKSDALMRVLDDLHRRSMLARVVVDEAHCVSQWGHDFRPDYKGLSVFKLRCVGCVPLVAVGSFRPWALCLVALSHASLSNLELPLWPCLLRPRPTLVALSPVDLTHLVLFLAPLSTVTLSGVAPSPRILCPVASSSSSGSFSCASSPLMHTFLPSGSFPL